MIGLIISHGSEGPSPRIPSNIFSNFQQLRKAADAEQQLRVKCREVERLGDRERRLAKQVLQRGGDMELRAQLEKVGREREWAQRELAEQRAEAEWTRMVHLGAALGGMAEVQLNLARADQLIFGCQRELAEFCVPSGGGGIAAGAEAAELRQNYTGTPHTQQRLAELRRALANAEVGEAELEYSE